MSKMAESFFDDENCIAKSISNVISKYESIEAFIKYYRNIKPH